MIRQLLYRWEAYKYRKRFDFLLAMGENGFRWYCDNGWPVEKVFSFAYITELYKMMGDLQDKPSTDSETSPVQLLYIGQMIQRKGVDILIRALANISAGSNWHLSLLGSGPMEKAYHEITDRLGLGAQVSFLGSRPHSEVLDEINRADLLILPSRFDGWGAVINESLICGTPVLCSNLCGAKDLLAETWRGEVIPAGNVAKWTAGLSWWIAKGRLPAPERRRIREWSYRISGPAGARYFMAIMGHVYHNSLRPIPPWQSGQP
jgi:glycosyltransferase involved in cell wall biosynthesis